MDKPIARSTNKKFYKKIKQEMIKSSDEDPNFFSDPLLSNSDQLQIDYAGITQWLPTFAVIQYSHRWLKLFYWL